MLPSLYCSCFGGTLNYNFLILMYLILKWLLGLWHASWCSKLEFEENKTPCFENYSLVLLIEKNLLSQGSLLAKISWTQHSNLCFSAFVSMWNSPSHQLGCSSISWRVSILDLPMIAMSKEGRIWKQAIENMNHCGSLVFQHKGFDMNWH